MIPKKRSRNTARSPRELTTEYRLKIDAYTPETMPMARLAEYITNLAEVLGEPNAVHFARLEPGSTAVVARIEREAIPKIQERTRAVRRGDAPRDAIRAYHRINKLLQADNGVGRLEDKKASLILRFPGREASEEYFPSVRQHGSIEARVVRVGGVDETIPVLLESEGEQIANCWTNRIIAKQLAQKLFEYVRLYGIGRWCRDRDGVWSLADFKIMSFEVLQEEPLSAALGKLRAVAGGDWTNEAYGELAVIRRGPPRSHNGGD